MLGNMIKTKRVFLGIKAIDLARKLGISIQTYNKYENNKLDIPTSKLVKIFDILNIDIDYKL